MNTRNLKFIAGLAAAVALALAPDGVYAAGYKDLSAQLLRCADALPSK